MTPGPIGWTVVFCGLVFCATALGIARRRVLATAVGGAGTVLLLAAALGYAGAPAGSELSISIVGLVVLPVAVVLYPDGRLPGPYGPVATFVVAGTGGLAVVRPERFLDIASLTLVVEIVAVVGWRYEIAAEGPRRALLWLALGAGGGGLAAGMLEAAGADWVFQPAPLVATLAIAPCVVIGVRRPDLVDVRRLIVSCAVFIVTLLSFVSVFAGIAAVASLLTGAPPPLGVLALLGGCAAAAFEPMRRALRDAIDRMLFGDRLPPIAAASQVGARISDDPADALDTLCDALALPYAALVRSDHVVATSGVAPPRTSHIPLRVGEETAGELVVGLRGDATALDATEATALRLLAPALAQALLARDLAARLVASRAELITAVEDERRRLRHDLHDGLGPTLTGVAFAADAARNTVVSDPDGAQTLIAGLRHDVAAAIVEIRRLVEGLRPPALDELGLLGALRQHAARMRFADGRPLTVHLAVSVPADVPGSAALPPLPAAIEVATFRIVVEALTNVARHAGGDAGVSVCLEPTPRQLRIEIRDDGYGRGRQWTPGVGLTSMRTRAEQLDGTFHAGDGRVAVTLPLSF